MAKETRSYSDRRSYLSKATNRRRLRLKQKMSDYKGGCCQICGYTRYIGALDFHHIKPEEKKFNLSVDNLFRSWALILEELDKCVMICSNCHREVHAKIIDLSKIRFGWYNPVVER